MTSARFGWTAVYGSSLRGREEIKNYSEKKVLCKTLFVTITPYSTIIYDVDISADPAPRDGADPVRISQ
jgi:hypothetical protein